MSLLKSIKQQLGLGPAAENHLYQALHAKFIYDPLTGQFSRRDTGKLVGYIHKSGYVKITLCGKEYRAHRLAFLYVEGRTPEHIDHVNTNKADNRWCNIRECTHAENMQNQKVGSNNESGYRGVRYYARLGKFVARIRTNGKLRHIGYFDTLEQAVEAYQDMKVAMHPFYSKEGELA